VIINPSNSACSEPISRRRIWQKLSNPGRLEDLIGPILNYLLYLDPAAMISNGGDMAEWSKALVLGRVGKRGHAPVRKGVGSNPTVAM
jgi:hypothetical protein